MAAGDVRPKTHCECGEWIADSMFEKHREGQKHKNAMADKRARARGHHYFVRDDVALACMKFGLSAHFTQVRSELYSAKDTMHWKTSSEVIAVLSRFNSRQDDRKEDTMHAALVFVSVYGAETPKVLVNMIDTEINAGNISTGGDGRAIATRESDLVALLRANGVRAPALTLTNLMPHLLSIALSELPGCVQ